jgi:uncharacterized protein with HEPN domain
MNRKSPTPFIDDIIKSSSKIQNYTSGLTLSKFKKDELIQDGVIRNIEIIGEACNHLSDDFKKSYPEIPWREIKTMRNRLTHEYWYINLTIVWNTAKKDIPSLIKSLQRYLLETVK